MSACSFKFKFWRLSYPLLAPPTSRIAISAGGYGSAISWRPCEPNADLWPSCPFILGNISDQFPFMAFIWFFLSPVSNSNGDPWKFWWIKMFPITYGFHFGARTPLCPFRPEKLGDGKWNNLNAWSNVINQNENSRGGLRGGINNGTSVMRWKREKEAAPAGHFVILATTGLMKRFQNSCRWSFSIENAVSGT